MTEDQRNLGLIHPCLHKQNENRIPAFYRKFKTREGSNCFSWRIQPRVRVLSHRVLREALDGQESRGRGGVLVCSSRRWVVRSAVGPGLVFLLCVRPAALHTCAYGIFIWSTSCAKWPEGKRTDQSQGNRLAFISTGAEFGHFISSAGGS